MRSVAATGQAGSDASSRRVTRNLTAEAYACQSSWVAWTKKNIRPAPYTNTSSIFQITLGTADVYTSSQGIPVAHGSMTSTGTTWYTSFYLDREYPTVDRGIPQPTCLIDENACTAMYSSYMNSQGLTLFKDTIGIMMTSAPTNSPRCGLPLMQLDANGDGISTSGSPCSFYGDSDVKLYYWPSANDAVSGHAGSRANSSAIVTTHIGNRTLTSPYVYLSIGRITASSDAVAFTIRDTTLITMSPVESEIGKTYLNVLFSMDPKDVSTIRYGVSNFGATNWNAFISRITAPGSDWSLPGWDNYAVYGTQFPVDYDRITAPSPQAYYLNPNFSNDCMAGSLPMCGTIFEGNYHAQLAMPTQLQRLDPRWSTCLPYYPGLPDPPIALQAAPSVATPTDPSVVTTSPTSAAQAGETMSVPTASATAFQGTVTLSSTSAGVESTAPVLAPTVSHSDPTSRSNMASTTVLASIAEVSILTQSRSDPDLGVSDVDSSQGYNDPTSVGDDTTSVQQYIPESTVRATDVNPGANTLALPTDPISGLTQYGAAPASIPLKTIVTSQSTSPQPAMNALQVLSAAESEAQSGRDPSESSGSLSPQDTIDPHHTQVAPSQTGENTAAIAATVIFTGTSDDPARSEGILVDGVTLYRGDSTVTESMPATLASGTADVEGSTVGEPVAQSLPNGSGQTTVLHIGSVTVAAVAHGTLVAVQTVGPGRAAVAAGEGDATDPFLGKATSLHVGGSAVTIAGETISLGSNGLVAASGRETSTIEPTNLSHRIEAIVTVGSSTFTAYVDPGNSDAVVFDGTTLSPGGPGLSVNGKSLSMVQGGIVVAGPSKTATASLKTALDTSESRQANPTASTSTHMTESLGSSAAMSPTSTQGGGARMGLLSWSICWLPPALAILSICYG